jgi:MFS family permease
VPPKDWQPAGWTPPTQRKTMMAQGHVHVERAWRLPQFWLLWGVLCMNVSAGIGVLGMASPMIQEIFGGKLIGVGGIPLADLTTAQKAEVASIAAGFTGLLSLANIIGRLFWASLSDTLGRKRTYMIFFAAGAVLYALVPLAGKLGNPAVFVAIFFVILTMYGGGFSTIPAYLADIFGTQFVGAIHGRLLTAWSTAGILGPILVNYIREYQISRGVPAASAYNVTMYILAAMLVVGFFCNLAMKPVKAEHFMSELDLGSIGATPAK